MTSPLSTKYTALTTGRGGCGHGVGSSDLESLMAEVTAPADVRDGRRMVCAMGPMPPVLRGGVHHCLSKASRSEDVQVEEPGREARLPRKVKQLWSDSQYP
jgi:hypothetical protein